MSCRVVAHPAHTIEQNPELVQPHPPLIVFFSPPETPRRAETYLSVQGLQSTNQISCESLLCCSPQFFRDSRLLSHVGDSHCPPPCRITANERIRSPYPLAAHQQAAQPYAARPIDCPGMSQGKTQATALGIELPGQQNLDFNTSSPAETGSKTKTSHIRRAVSQVKMAVTARRASSRPVFTPLHFTPLQIGTTAPMRAFCLSSPSVLRDPCFILHGRGAQFNFISRERGNKRSCCGSLPSSVSCFSNSGRAKCHLTVPWSLARPWQRKRAFGTGECHVALNHACSKR